MLTNNDAKLIKSLYKKKFRQKYNKFVIEGIKIIKEVENSSLNILKIYSTNDTFDNSKAPVVHISERELKKISNLVTPNSALAVCEIPANPEPKNTGFILALDKVRDPGNFGTIVRMADWFGIEQIVCSPDTVGLYNPKVLQATMGSFVRVAVSYLDLNDFFSTYKGEILGAYMEGENIYKTNFPDNAVLVMGNEANGISEEVSTKITQKISIPRMGKIQETESLNVAVATGIILGERASKKFS